MLLPHPQSFTKMHGLGNDFVVLSALQTSPSLTSQSIAALADRHLGIGFDQLLIIEPSKTADFFCRIFNADGTEAEQCGNGLRCIARFVHEYGLTVASHFKIATKAGVFPITIKDYDHISVSIHAENKAIEAIVLSLIHSPHPLTLHTITLGNPHAIIKVEQLDPDWILDVGQKLATHQQFPQGINVGFMQVIDSTHIKLSTYERGVGPTHACGSNAAAATIVGIANGWLEDGKEITISYPYGSLVMQWHDKNAVLKMTGPATHVFSGSVVIDGE